MKWEGVCSTRKREGKRGYAENEATERQKDRASQQTVTIATVCLRKQLP